MKRMARIALVVVVLIGAMVRVGWSEADAEQPNAQDDISIKNNANQQKIILTEQVERGLFMLLRTLAKSMRILCFFLVN